MKNITQQTPTFKYLRMRPDEVSKVIQNEAPNLFSGATNVRKVTWIKFSESFGWKNTFNHMLEYYLNPDYEKFLEKEFKDFKEQLAQETKNRIAQENESINALNEASMEKAKNEYLKANNFWEAVRYDPIRLQDSRPVKLEDAQNWEKKSIKDLGSAKAELDSAKATLDSAKTKNTELNQDEAKKNFEEAKKHYAQKLKLLNDRTLMVQVLLEKPENFELVPNDLLEVVKEKKKAYQNALAKYNEEKK